MAAGRPAEAEASGEEGEGSALTRLHLACAELDDALAAELAGGCPALVALTLEGCRGLTGAGVAAVVQVGPGAACSTDVWV